MWCVIIYNIKMLPHPRKTMLKGIFTFDGGDSNGVKAQWSQTRIIESSYSLFECEYLFLNIILIST